MKKDYVIGYSICNLNGMRKTRFIIPDKTFHANELGENSVIFCIRKKKTEKVEDEQEETDYIFNNDK